AAARGAGTLAGRAPSGRGPQGLARARRAGAAVARARYLGRAGGACRGGGDGTGDRGGGYERGCDPRGDRRRGCRRAPRRSHGVGRGGAPLRGTRRAGSAAHPGPGGPGTGDEGLQRRRGGGADGGVLEGADCWMTRVLLVPDLPLERWPAMDRYAHRLYDWLENADPGLEVRLPPPIRDATLDARHGRGGRRSARQPRRRAPGRDPRPPPPPGPPHAPPARAAPP